VPRLRSLFFYGYCRRRLLQIGAQVRRTRAPLLFSTSLRASFPARPLPTTASRVSGRASSLPRRFSRFLLVAVHVVPRGAPPRVPRAFSVHPSVFFRVVVRHPPPPPHLSPTQQHNTDAPPPKKKTTRLARPQPPPPVPGRLPPRSGRVSFAFFPKTNKRGRHPPPHPLPPRFAWKGTNNPHPKPQTASAVAHPLRRTRPPALWGALFVKPDFSLFSGVYSNPPDRARAPGPHPPCRLPRPAQKLQPTTKEHTLTHTFRVPPRNSSLPEDLPRETPCR